MVDIVFHVNDVGVPHLDFQVKFVVREVFRSEWDFIWIYIVNVKRSVFENAEKFIRLVIFHFLQIFRKTILISLLGFQFYFVIEAQKLEIAIYVS